MTGISKRCMLNRHRRNKLKKSGFKFQRWNILYKKEVEFIVSAEIDTSNSRNVTVLQVRDRKFSIGTC